MHPYKILIKTEDYYTMDKPDQEYFIQGTKFSIISKGTDWNSVLSDKMEEGANIFSVFPIKTL